ncbi:hypothetical protein [Nonlabens dokdonensis]|uniref:hypothetical protein n=1 Tax=Nonlabens dokdonensis TaxID=328515 RepID=UPI0026ECAACC|nr:hypothetical protein [Nonlabens dokdonensis]
MKTALIYFLLMIIQVLAVESIYSKDAGFFDGAWSTNDTKFLMIEFFTISVSILMLYLDKNKEKPHWPYVVITGLLATLFPFLLYELAKSLEWNVVIAMIAAFFIGAFGLSILLVARSRIKDVTNSWIDKLKPKE